MIIKPKNIISLDQVSSTNDYMIENIKSGIIQEEGSVVVANYQTAGKGLDKNKWESEAGKNLLFSILLKPAFLPADQ